MRVYIRNEPPAWVYGRWCKHLGIRDYSWRTGERIWLRRGVELNLALDIFRHEIGHVFGASCGTYRKEEFKGQNFADLFAMTVEEIKRGEERVRLAFTKKA